MTVITEVTVSLVTVVDTLISVFVTTGRGEGRGGEGRGGGGGGRIINQDSQTAFITVTVVTVKYTTLPNKAMYMGDYTTPHIVGHESANSAGNTHHTRLRSMSCRRTCAYHNDHE